MGDVALDQIGTVRRCLESWLARRDDPHDEVNEDAGAAGERQQDEYYPYQGWVNP
jgi:hypothetical protein